MTKYSIVTLERIDLKDGIEIDREKYEYAFDELEEAIKKYKQTASEEAAFISTFTTLKFKSNISVTFEGRPFFSFTITNAA